MLCEGRRRGRRRSPGWSCRPTPAPSSASRKASRMTRGCRTIPSVGPRNRALRRAVRSGSTDARTTPEISRSATRDRSADNGRPRDSRKRVTCLSARVARPAVSATVFAGSIGLEQPCVVDRAVVDERIEERMTKARALGALIVPDHLSRGFSRRREDQAGRRAGCDVHPRAAKGHEAIRQELGHCRSKCKSVTTPNARGFARRSAESCPRRRRNLRYNRATNGAISHSW